MDNEQKERLEFLVRQYQVVTEELCRMLEEVEDELPIRTKAALMLLANSINQDW